MIGSDEFNVRKSQSTSKATSDYSDMEYIETFLASNAHLEDESGFLIDIICPQPKSKRPKGLSGRNSDMSQANMKSGRK